MGRRLFPVTDLAAMRTLPFTADRQEWNHPHPYPLP